MWIKTQNNVLVNLDQMESVFTRGNQVICAGHKYDKDTKNERLLGTFETNMDASLITRLIWEAIKAGETTFFLPEKLTKEDA